MSTKRVVIPGSVPLEGRLREGEGTKGVIVCHPHPLYGGSMHNNVVDALEEGFSTSGFTTLCFNFRGVGTSGGDYDEGLGEVDDLVEAAAYVRGTLQEDAALVLAGYSFGAWIAAMAAARIDSVGALCLVAYPFSVYPADPLNAFGGPIYFFAGSMDEIAPADRLMQVCEDLTKERHMKVVASSHFFPGWELAITEFVTGHFS